MTLWESQLIIDEMLIEMTQTNRGLIVIVIVIGIVWLSILTYKVFKKPRK